MIRLRFSIIVILSVCTTASSFSQEIEREVVSSQGGIYLTNDVELEWTIGEVLITALDTCFATFGFHQSFLAKGCGFNDPEAVPFDEDLTIYPVPVTDVLTIQIDKGLIRQVSIYDLVGARVFQLSYEDLPMVNIDMYDLASGPYVVKVNTNTRYVKRKIIKTN